MVSLFASTRRHQLHTSPSRRLGYWRFDSPLLYAEQGQMPLSSSNVTTVPSWSGTALSICSSASSQVTYPDVGSNGWANFNCRQGSVRFWFKPNSSSGPGGSGGAPFFYVGWPRLSTRQLGLVIGNNTGYNSPINGQFEEFETFNFQLPAFG
jgi:hypothetical protein